MTVQLSTTTPTLSQVERHNAQHAKQRHSDVNSRSHGVVWCVQRHNRLIKAGTWLTIITKLRRVSCNLDLAYKRCIEEMINSRAWRVLYWSQWVIRWSCQRSKEIDDAIVKTTLRRYGCFLWSLKWNNVVTTRETLHRFADDFKTILRQFSTRPLTLETARDV